MKRLLLTALLAMMLSNQTWAAPATSYRAIGMADCGEWVKSQTTGTQKQSDRAWLLGFLSGLNQNDIYKNALAKISSAEQIYLWMDNHCKANPLKSVGEGGFKLMNELMQKK